jgi:chromosome segregation ATPase
MAKVGAQRAAELTGKSKSTIQRAMKSGKISFELDHNNRRVIDVAELERAFGLVPQNNGSTADNVESELQKAKEMLEAERLRMRIKLLEEQLDSAKEQIDDLKGQREQWQKQAQQVLLTSQHSQKQAEELKAEIKERERRFRAYRKQEMERRNKGVNENRILKTQSETNDGRGFDIQGLWHKIRGQNDKEEQVA